MSIYLNIYHSICNTRKINKISLKRGSGLHAHHILPKHMGGMDLETNLTYLTVREHKIAHFLLWKIYKNVNDLRAMHMLGVCLTVAQRSIVGKWCYKNKIGIHAIPFEQTLYNLEKGRLTQKRNYEETGEKSSWYYWSTSEGRRERSSMGGKLGSKTIMANHTGLFGRSPEKIKLDASLGGKAHRGKKWYYNPLTLDKILTQVNDIIPIDYIAGRPPNGTGNKKTFHNHKTKESIIILKCDIHLLSDEWKPGSLPGKRSYHDPVTYKEIKLYENEIPPIGYIRGGRPRSKTPNSN